MNAVVLLICQNSILLHLPHKSFTRRNFFTVMMSTKLPTLNRSLQNGDQHLTL